MFKERLFTVETPLLSCISLGCLQANKDINFMYENEKSISWTLSAEEVEFDTIFFKCNNLNTLENKKLVMALYSTGVTDLYLLDDMIESNSNDIKQKWALSIYLGFLDIENERIEFENESPLMNFPISVNTCVKFYS